MHSKCSHFTIEPLRWIGNDILQSKGTISCYGCNHKVGEWNWKRWNKCSCGSKIKTAFAIQKKELKYVERSEPSKSPILSPRSRRAKSKLSGMLSRKAFHKDVVAPEHPKTQIKKEARERYPSPVFACCYNDLPKDLQKFPIRAKIEPEIIDQNWYPVTQVYRFAAKCRVIPMPVCFICFLFFVFY